MNKKKQMIIIGVITILVVIVVGTLGFSYWRKKSKSEESLKAAIEYLQGDKYVESITELEKSISYNNKNLKSIKTLEVVTKFQELKNLYEKKEFTKAIDLISKIRSLEESSLIKDKIILIENSITITTEIEGLNSNIDELIAEKSYEEGIKTINSYLQKNINDEDKDKLNKLLDKIKKAEASYKEEQKRKEEAEAIKKSTINNENDAEARVKELSEIREYMNKNIQLYFMSSKNNFNGNEWGQPELDGIEGYNVEVRAQSPDPVITNAVGFYFVDKNTKNVYKMDIIKCKYELVN